MATIQLPKNPIANWETLRDEWISRLSSLVECVQGWAQEFGWSTRRIEKRMEDSQIGTYQAPALLMQHEFTRGLLEPIARFGVGVEGVVDLYLMPAYDDVATLFYENGGWHVRYAFPDPSIVTPPREKAKLLSRESFAEILEEMKKNAA